MKPCSFCHSRIAAASDKSGTIACCRECASPGGPAAKLVAEAAGGRGGSPMVVPGSPAEMNLLAAAKRARATARRQGRDLVGAELSLSLAATAIEQRAATVAAARRQRQPRRLVGTAATKEAAKKMVTKLGLSVPAAPARK
jgi:hypothetical protein